MLSFLPPLCFFGNALLTRVHLNFSSCRTSRVDVEPRLLGIRPALLPFKLRNKDRKGALSSVSKFEYAVGQCYVGILFSDVSVDFGSQVAFPPHRRWDLYGARLRPSGRKPLREQFICPRVWRCGAWEFLAEMSKSLRSFEGCVCPAFSTRLPLC